MLKKITFSLFLCFILVSCFSQKQGEKVTLNNTDSGSYNKPFILTKEEKIEQLKRRTGFRSVIRKGDFYSIKNMKETALQYYLDVYSKLQYDHVLEKKIAETYFELKNYKNAYKYYKKMPVNELDEKLSKRMVLSLMYTNDEKTKEELKNMDISQGQKDYYSMTYDCYSGIKKCIETIKSYSGSSEGINKFKTEILNFEKNPGIDSNSKYALMAGTFLKNGDFLAASLIGEETLIKRPNYKSVLKITGYSYYELGNYEKANEYLQKYYNFEPKDVQISYLLGVINFYLENYIASNLYFNAAVLNGYSPKTELERRLIYNYYVLGDEKNLIKIFRYLLDEQDANEDDYSVAIFTAIENDELSKALLWVNKGIQKFNTSDMMYAFRGWIYKNRNEEDNSKSDLNKALDLNPKNTIALLNLGIWSFEKKDYNIARKYFKDTIKLDKDGTFGNEAELQLEKLNKQEELEKSSSGALIPKGIN